MTAHSSQTHLARSGLLLAAPLAAVLVASACGGGGGGGSGSSAASSPMPSMSMSSGAAEGGTLTVDGKQVNNHGAKTVTGMSSVNVEMDDFYFEPTVLKGKPGQKLTLHLENEGQAPHTFTLSGQNIDKVVQPGDEATVTITFPDKTTVFDCRFHVAQGMRGVLQTAGGSAGASGGSSSDSSGGGSSGGGYSNY